MEGVWRGGWQGSLGGGVAPKDVRAIYNTHKKASLRLGSVPRPGCVLDGGGMKDAGDQNMHM